MANESNSAIEAFQIFDPKDSAISNLEANKRCCECLGVAVDANAKVIKRAYLKLAQKYHPDKNVKADEPKSSDTAAAGSEEASSSDSEPPVEANAAEDTAANDETKVSEEGEGTKTNDNEEIFKKIQFAYDILNEFDEHYGMTRDVFLSEVLPVGTDEFVLPQELNTSDLRVDIAVQRVRTTNAPVSDSTQLAVTGSDSISVNDLLYTAGYSCHDIVRIAEKNLKLAGLILANQQLCRIGGKLGFWGVHAIAALSPQLAVMGLKFHVEMMTYILGDGFELAKCYKEACQYALKTQAYQEAFTGAQLVELEEHYQSDTEFAPWVKKQISNTPLLKKKYEEAKQILAAELSVTDLEKYVDQRNLSYDSLKQFLLRSEALTLLAFESRKIFEKLGSGLFNLLYSDDTWRSISLARSFLSSSICFDAVKNGARRIGELRDLGELDKELAQIILHSETLAWIDLLSGEDIEYIFQAHQMSAGDFSPSQQVSIIYDAYTRLPAELTQDSPDITAVLSTIVASKLEHYKLASRLRTAPESLLSKLLQVSAIKKSLKYGVVYICRQYPNLTMQIVTDPQWISEMVGSSLVDLCFCSVEACSYLLENNQELVNDITGKEVLSLVEQHSASAPQIIFRNRILCQKMEAYALGREVFKDKIKVSRGNMSPDASQDDESEGSRLFQLAENFFRQNKISLAFTCFIQAHKEGSKGALAKAYGIFKHQSNKSSDMADTLSQLQTEAHQSADDAIRLIEIQNKIRDLYEEISSLKNQVQKQADQLYSTCQEPQTTFVQRGELTLLFSQTCLTEHAKGCYKFTCQVAPTEYIQYCLTELPLEHWKEFLSTHVGQDKIENDFKTEFTVVLFITMIREAGRSEIFPSLNTNRLSEDKPRRETLGIQGLKLIAHFIDLSTLAPDAQSEFVTQEATSIFAALSNRKSKPERVLVLYQKLLKQCPYDQLVYMSYEFSQVASNAVKCRLNFTNIGFKQETDSYTNAKQGYSGPDLQGLLNYLFTASSKKETSLREETKAKYDAKIDFVVLRIAELLAGKTELTQANNFDVSSYGINSDTFITSIGHSNELSVLLEPAPQKTHAQSSGEAGAFFHL